MLNRKAAEWMSNGPLSQRKLFQKIICTIAFSFLGLICRVPDCSKQKQGQGNAAVSVFSSAISFGWKRGHQWNEAGGWAISRCIIYSYAMIPYQRQYLFIYGGQIQCIWSSDPFLGFVLYFFLDWMRNVGGWARVVIGWKIGDDDCHAPHNVWGNKVSVLTNKHDYV